MIPHTARDMHPLATSNLFLVVMIVLWGALMLVSAVSFQAPHILGMDKSLADFDAFHIAGTLYWEGHVTDAYHTKSMVEAQQRISGTQSFMPWTYPPQFTLVTALLALLPIGISYALFTSVSFAFYLFVLRKLAGNALPGVLMAIFPAVTIEVRCGQNGFLVAGLIGVFLLSFSKKRAIAGVPLGLMIIKPHLAAGIALLTLLGKRWAAMGIAAAIVILSSLLATAIFGVEIWASFFSGIREAGRFLSLGWYPLFRMTSLYAALRSVGVAPGLAFTVHLVGAAIAILFLLKAWFAKWKPHLQMAIACVVSIFISPYNYDYDLTILGLAAALVLPDILERAKLWELISLGLLSWFTTGWGLAKISQLAVASAARSGETNAPSAAAWGLILLIVMSCHILRRPPALSKSQDPALTHTVADA